MEPWSRPVPSTVSPTVNSYRPVEKISPVALYRPVPSRSRPVYKTYPYRPVPSSKPAPTVPSRLQNVPLPSRPVVKTYPYRPVPPSKPVPTVKSRGQNLSLPSRPAIHCRHSFPSRCRHRQDARNTLNSFYSINSMNTCSFARQKMSGSLDL